MRTPSPLITVHGVVSVAHWEEEIRRITAAAEEVAEEMAAWVGR